MVHMADLLAKKIGHGEFDKDLWDKQMPVCAARLQIKMEALPMIEKEVLTLMEETDL